MPKSVLKRSFDTVLPNRATPILAVRGDYNARFIDAAITTNGEPEEIPSAALVMINVTRPDGERNGFAGEVSGDNSVLVPITQWALEKVGTVSCSISVLGAGTKLTTTRFVIEVQEQLYEGEEPSEDSPSYDVWNNVLVTLQSVENLLSSFINVAEVGQ